MGSCYLFAKLCLTLPWTAAHQTPLSMGFPGQEYWSRLLFPSPGDRPKPDIKPMSPTLAGRFFTTEPSGKRTVEYYLAIKENEIMPFAAIWMEPRDYHSK